jgi:hypothetical protein
MAPSKKSPCSNAGHNVGESPCPKCGCGFTDPCLVLGCPHCDRATTKNGQALTKTARALKLAEATMFRQEQASARVLKRLLKTRAEVVRLRAKLAKLETPQHEEG